MPSYDSGLGRTLADLMYRRGQQESAMHLERGDQQARLWMGAGQAVAGAVDDWTRRVELNRRNALDMAEQADRRKLAGIQIRAAEGQIQDQDTERARLARAEKANDAFSRYLVQGADGMTRFDVDTIAQEFEREGLSAELPRMLPVIEGLNKSAEAFRQMQQDTIAGMFAPMLEGGEINPDSVKLTTEYLRRNHMAPANDLDGIDALVTQHPDQATEIVRRIVSTSPTVAQKWLKPEEYTLNPGDVRFRGGQPVAVVPPVEKPPTNIEDAILAQMPNATPDELIAIKERIARAGRQVTPAAAEPLVPIVGEDGRPVLVPRSQAVGKQPASTREQGRQVTSGDAGDLAEFQTALDDVATLRATLQGNAATGASAQLGAALPNAVTEFTGWGSDAKQKQAVIDRVKQVIGKALEGGVLRKEDETKYAKILPTIGDPPDVVDAKLAGLDAALQQRQRRKMSALEDAGYDVSRFQARPVGGTAARPDANGWQTIDGIRVRVKQ